jgi:uncharacterized linocin/CFP29 family protein
MADLLQRTLAPIPDAAWDEIDEIARTRLEGNLSARYVADFCGPKGYECSSVNIGRTTACTVHEDEDVQCCVREVLPLVEIRVPFNLKLSELMNATRGAKDVEWDALEKAAVKAARFEEDAIYNGMKCLEAPGILETATNKPVDLPSDLADYPGAVSQAMLGLQTAGIPGPYTLVLGGKAFRPLNNVMPSGRSLRAVVSEQIGGDVLWSPALKDGGVLMASGEGNFELTIGQDFSVGYCCHGGHDEDDLCLFLVETFAFRMLEPRAAVELKLQTSPTA